MICGPEIPIRSLEEFKNKLKLLLKDTQYSYKVSKARQSAQSSRRYRLPSYSVGDMVFINKYFFTDTYARVKVSKNLSGRRFSPFAVKELIGKNAFRLEFSSHFKIHLVVHVIHTTPYVKQPSDIAPSIPAEPEPVPRIEGNEYEVENILAHRRKGRGYQFLTLMKGYPF